MSDKHLSSQFDADLNAVSSKVLEMGGLVESQIVGAMYALLVFVFRLDAVTAELAATASWLIAATFALGAVLLFLYDELLRRFARLYRRRKRG